MPEVKERPILFSAPMVRSLLDERKTQTRRIVKPQPTWKQDILSRGLGDPCPGVLAYQEGPGCWHHYGSNNFCEKFCKQGKPGDRLWVKENYRIESFSELMGCDDWALTIKYGADGDNRYIYQCDAPADVGFWPGAAIRKYEGKNRPCIFMYRWVSRITLEIIGVRVERLQDISHEDCIAEGIEPVAQLGIMRACGWKDYSGKTVGFLYPRDSYKSLWESINGAGSWDLNPWVFAISFRKI